MFIFIRIQAYWKAPLGNCIAFNKLTPHLERTWHRQPVDIKTTSLSTGFQIERG